MLVGPDGRVFHTVGGNVDFATDLADSPFDGNGLARAFRAAREQRGTRLVHTDDFSFYRPTGDAPAAFMSTPVYDGGTFLSVLVAKLSTNRVQSLADAADQIGSAG